MLYFDGSGLIPNQVSDEFVSDSSRDPIVHVALKNWFHGIAFGDFRQGSLCYCILIGRCGLDFGWQACSKICAKDEFFKQGFALRITRGNVANHEIVVVLYSNGSSLNYLGIAVRLPHA